MPQRVQIDGLEEIWPLMTCIVLNWISRAVLVAGLKRLYAVLYYCNWKGVKCQINKSPHVAFCRKMIEEVLECSFCACAEGMKMPQNTSIWIWGVGRTMDGCVAQWLKRANRFVIWLMPQDAYQNRSRVASKALMGVPLLSESKLLSAASITQCPIYIGMD